ncbi:MAG: hypothetical protein FJ137_05975 [Deltaproteobacteria bacterium]|nr:hypothetical protein [Deltaproteobacteria bacterium]
MRCLAFVLVVALGVSSSTAIAAGGPQEFGLELMPSARKIGPQRYQSDRNYEATLKFFREKFRGSKNVRWMREVSVPGVKYVHLENDNPQSGWDGINIALQGDGAVTVYVLPRKQPAPTPAAPSPTASSPAARP